MNVKKIKKNKNTETKTNMKTANIFCSCFFQSPYTSSSFCGFHRKRNDIMANTIILIKITRVTERKLQSASKGENGIGS